MIAAAEKGLDYTLKKVHCKRGEPKDPELCKIFATLAPGGAAATVTVPLLQHLADGQLVQVIESAHCAEYINDVWHDRAPLWPVDPRQRVAVRQLTEVGGSCGFLFPLFASAEELPAKLVEHAEKLKLLEGCLQKYASGGDLLLGEHMCMAEVLLGSLVIRWRVVGELRGFMGLQLCDDLGLHRARRWLHALATRPSVVDTYPPPDSSAFDRVEISYSVVDGMLQDVRVASA